MDGVAFQQDGWQFVPVEVVAVFSLVDDGMVVKKFRWYHGLLLFLILRITLIILIGIRVQFFRITRSIREIRSFFFRPFRPFRPRVHALFKGGGRREERASAT